MPNGKSWYRSRNGSNLVTPLREQLAAGLLHLRTIAGLSRGQLALSSGFSRPSLNHLERGITGGMLDTADRYAAGCRGTLTIVASARGEEARAALAEAVATMPLEDVDVLLRLVRARPHLPDLEWRLLADATELRVRALSSAEQPAPRTLLPR